MVILNEIVAFELLRTAVTPLHRIDKIDVDLISDIAVGRLLADTATMAVTNSACESD